MATQPVPGYTPAPTPAIQRGDRATFSGRVDAFMSWLQTAPAQFKALGDNAYHNANEANTFAVNAQAYRDAAQGYRDQTLIYRDAAAGHVTMALNHATSAMGYRDQAQGYRDAAQGFRDQAAVSATALTATSASGHQMTTGVKDFTIPTGKSFTAGVPVTAVHTADASQKLYGNVVSYIGSVLKVDVTSVEGSGTFAGWNVTVSGTRGQQGIQGPSGSISGAASATLTGAAPLLVWDETDQAGAAGKWRAVADGSNWRLDRNTATARDFSTAVSPIEVTPTSINFGLPFNEKRDLTGITAAASIDLTATTGNTVNINGSTSISTINLPQGAKRTLVMASNGGSFIHNTSVLLVPGAANYTWAVGDTVEVLSEGVNVTRILRITRYSGKAVVESPRPVPNLQVITASGSFTVPATDFEVTLIGGGAGGGAGSNNGGSSGGTVIKRFSGATVGATATVVIGGGGASSTAGGSSSFTLTGFTTLSAGGGAGSGGAATGGDINIPGQRGGKWTYSDTNADPYPGSGADSIYGLGGRGAGDSGTGYGSGGSGGYTTPGSGAQSGGGAGAPGVMIVRW